MAYCDYSDLPSESCSHCDQSGGGGRADEVMALARKLLQFYGLSQAGWVVRFDRAKNRFGRCSHQLKIISLSRDWAELREIADSRITIIHEIAHALVGPGHGHNETWQAKARSLGIEGRACSDAKGLRLERPIIGTCSKGHTTERFKRPTLVISCGRCSPSFSLAHIFTWTRDGQPFEHTAKYRAHLAAAKLPHLSNMT